MAIGKGPLILVAAVAAAFALKKRNGAEGLTLRGETGDDEPPPDDGLPPIEMKGGSGPREKPEDALWHFLESYEAAVDDCFVELGMTDALDIMVCAMNKIFPAASWPPPSNAQQWQRTYWGHPGFNEYVVAQYPPIT